MKPNHIRAGVAAVVCLGIMFGLAGCAGWDSPYRATQGRMSDDLELTKDVKAALAGEPGQGFSEIEVSTFRNAVVLSGFVDTEEQRMRALEIARQVPAVREVVNHLALRTQPGSEVPNTSGSAMGSNSSPDTVPAGAPAVVPPVQPAEPQAEDPAPK